MFPQQIRPNERAVQIHDERNVFAFNHARMLADSVGRWQDFYFNAPRASPLFCRWSGVGKKAAVNAPQSRRFAQTGRLLKRAQRLDCGCFSTALNVVGFATDQASSICFQRERDEIFLPLAVI